MTKKKRPPRGGMDAKGRKSGGESHWRISRSMATSMAFRSLSGSALKVLCEIHARFNGYNNGEIVAGCGDLAKKLHMGKTTVHEALKELVAKGFIRRTSPGRFYGRKAATWRITDAPYGSEETAPNDWRRWQPEKPGKTTKARRTPMGLVSEDDIEAEKAARNSGYGTVAERKLH